MVYSSHSELNSLLFCNHMKCEHQWPCLFLLSIKFTNDVFSSLDKGHYKMLFFLDLTKAFDLVGHYLLDKLAIGLPQQALFWLNAYLHKCLSVCFFPS